MKNFYRKILKNGMTVVFEKRDLPIVSVAFAVRYGGINEATHERGIAHFIEHMLYKGTPSRNSEKIAAEIERKGGVLNGFTDEPMTAFWCKIPGKHLKKALEVLGDMVSNPLFDENEMNKERKVILEEIKMYHDTPGRYVFDEIQKLLYKNPLGFPLIGTEKNLMAVNRTVMAKKFREIYHSKNMILCVVGNANMKELVRFAEKNFSRKKVFGKVPKQKIIPKNSSKTETRKGINQTHFLFANHVPLSNDKRNYAAIILNTLLAGGMSSRLFKEIREKRNLAYSISGGCAITKNFAHSTIYVGTKKESLDLVKKLVLQEFEKVSRGLAKEELESTKEQIIGQYEISIEDSQNQMVNLLGYEINGNAKNAYEFEKNIRAVKLEDVKKLSAEAVKKHSFFALVPD